MRSRRPPAQRRRTGVVAVGRGGLHRLSAEISQRITQGFTGGLREAHEILIVEIGPQAVGAQQQHVARL